MSKLINMAGTCKPCALFYIRFQVGKSQSFSGGFRMPPAMLKSITNPVNLQDVQVPADGERDNENCQDDPEDQVVPV